MASFDAFLEGYIEALFFSECDPDTGRALDDTNDPDDLTRAARVEIRRDCRGFFRDARSMIEGREREAGADFAFTRNGHGCGFWDGDWPEHGDALTALSRPYGTQGLYVYRGRVHVHG